MHGRVCMKRDTRPHLLTIKGPGNGGSHFSKGSEQKELSARVVQPCWTKGQARTKSIQKAAAEQALPSNSRGPRSQPSN